MSVSSGDPSVDSLSKAAVFHDLHDPVFSSVKDSVVQNGLEAVPHSSLPNPRGV